jgi:hypothetical protein
VLVSLVRTLQQELLADRQMLKQLAEVNELLRHKLAQKTADEVNGVKEDLQEVRGLR